MCQANQKIMFSLDDLSERFFLIVSYTIHAYVTISTVTMGNGPNCSNDQNTTLPNRKSITNEHLGFT